MITLISEHKLDTLYRVGVQINYQYDMEGINVRTIQDKYLESERSIFLEDMSAKLAVV